MTIHRPSPLTRAEAETNNEKRTWASWWTANARILTNLTAVALLAGLGFYTFMELHGVGSGGLLLTLILLGLVQVVLRLLAPGHFIRFAPQDLKDDHDFALKLNIQDATDLMVEIGDRAGQVLHAFIAMIIERDTYTFRIAERLELSRAWAVRRVDTAYRLPKVAPASADGERAPGEGAYCYVPVLVPAKGTLYADLKVETPQEGGITTLPFRRSKAVLIASMILAFRTAYGLVGYPSSWPKSVQDKFGELIALVIASKRKVDDLYGPAPLRDTKIREAVRVVLDRTVQIPCGRQVRQKVVDPTAFTQLQVLARLGMDRYCIVGEVLRTEALLRVSYEYRIKTTAIASPPRPAEFTQFPRVFFQKIIRGSGLFELSMRRAQLAQSYHLNVVCPQGSYIGWSTLEYGDNTAVRRIQPSYTSASVAYFRPLTTGHSSGHFYARSLDSLGANCRLRIRVYEKPYGSELIGLVAAIGSLSSIFLLYFGVINGSFSSTLVTAIIAAPTTIASIVALYVRAFSRAVMPSLAGVLNGALSIALGGTAMILYIAEAVRRNQPSTAPPEGWPWQWQVLVIAGSILVAGSVPVFLIRLLRFLAKRRGWSTMRAKVALSRYWNERRKLRPTN